MRLHKFIYLFIIIWLNASHIHIAHIGRVDTLIPQQSMLKPAPMLSLCYESLFIPTIWGGYTNQLAKDVHQLANGAIIITLQDQVVLHNGQLLTSDIVQQSIQFFQQAHCIPSVEAVLSSLKVDVLSPNTINIWGEDDQNIMEVLSKIPIIIPKDIPIGSGPYRIDTFNDQAITYQKHSGYWGDEHEIDTVTYRFFQSTFDAHIAFKHKAIDAYLETSATRFNQLVSLTPEQTQRLEHPLHQYTPYVWINPNGLLSDPSLRQVINTTLMPDIINQTLFNGHYHPHISIPLSERERMLQSCSLLEQKGYKLDHTMVRRKSDKQLTLTLLLPHHQWDALATLLSSRLRQLGIILIIEHQNPALYWEQVIKGQYDLVIEPLIPTQYQPIKLPKNILGHYLSLPIPRLLVDYQHKILLISSQKALLNYLIEQQFAIPLFSLKEYRVIHSQAFTATVNSQQEIIYRLA